jgi:hypothetical protein
MTSLSVDFLTRNWRSSISFAGDIFAFLRLKCLRFEREGTVLKISGIPSALLREKSRDSRTFDRSQSENIKHI